MGLQNMPNSGCCQQLLGVVSEPDSGTQPPLFLRLFDSSTLWVDDVDQRTNLPMSRGAVEVRSASGGGEENDEEWTDVDDDDDTNYNDVTDTDEGMIFFLF